MDNSYKTKDKVNLKILKIVTLYHRILISKSHKCTIVRFLNFKFSQDFIVLKNDLSFNKLIIHKVGYFKLAILRYFLSFN